MQRQSNPSHWRVEWKYLQRNTIPVSICLQWIVCLPGGANDCKINATNVQKTNQNKKLVKVYITGCCSIWNMDTFAKCGFLHCTYNNTLFSKWQMNQLGSSDLNHTHSLVLPLFLLLFCLSASLYFASLPLFASLPACILARGWRSDARWRLPCLASSQYDPPPSVKADTGLTNKSRFIGSSREEETQMLPMMCCHRLPALTFHTLKMSENQTKQDSHTCSTNQCHNTDARQSQPTKQSQSPVLHKDDFV